MGDELVVCHLKL